LVDVVDLLRLYTKITPPINTTATTMTMMMIVVLEPDPVKRRRCVGDGYEQ